MMKQITLYHHSGNERHIADFKNNGMEAKESLVALNNKIVARDEDLKFNFYYLEYTFKGTKHILVDWGDKNLLPDQPEFLEQLKGKKGEGQPDEGAAQKRGKARYRDEGTL